MTMALTDHSVPPSVLDSFDLSDERLEIVRKLDRNMLILAGPGAGKTYLLVAHAAWLAEQRIARVLLLTFSRNAANEMRHRLNRVLTQTRVADLVATKTLHEHALDLLRTHGHLIGLSPAIEILDAKDVEVIAAELSTKLRLPMPDRVASELDRYHRCLLYCDPNGETNPHVRLFEAIVEWMRGKRKLDWDTCIRFAIELLESQPFVVRSLQHHDRFILVDEAQDCDAAQLRLIDLLAGGKNSRLCVVMDPDQSLYGFRDADPENVLNWMRTSHDPVVFELAENRRCAPRIQALAQYVLRRPQSNWPSMAGSATFYRAKTRNDEARFVHTKIREWTEIENKMSVNDIAVLARSMRGYEATRQWLINQDIPVRSTPRNEWSDDEQRILLTIRFLAEWSEGRESSVATRRFLERVLGMPLPDIVRLEKRAFSSQVHSGDFVEDPRWLRLCERVSLERRKPVEIINDVREIFECSFDDDTSLLRLAGEARSLSDLLRRVRQGPKRDLHSITNDGVLISTFHGAKGLQFEAVFVIAAEEGMIPDFRAKTDTKLLEERRALYVALTRAAKFVVVCCVEQDGIWSKLPSSFLPPPNDLVWSSPDDTE